MFVGRNGVTFTSRSPSFAVPAPGALETPGPLGRWRSKKCPLAGRHRMMGKAEEGNCTMAKPRVHWLTRADPAPLLSLVRDAYW